MIEEMRAQFKQLLVSIGFLKASKGKGKGRRGGRKGRGKGKGDEANDKESMNDYGHVLQMVKAVICAGLYPNVLMVPPDKWPLKDGCKVADISFQSQKGGVAIHPCSVNWKATSLDSRYLVYHEMVSRYLV
jgi:hypothetical protein